MAENMRDMTLNLIVNSQVNKVKDFNKNLKDTENSITRTTHKVGWLSKTLGRVFGVYFGVQGVKYIVNTYKKLDLVRQSLNGLAGGAEAGARQFEYLRKEAFRTATDFTTIATKYRNFYAAAKGAGFGEQETQSMFSGLLTAGRALGADKQSIGGALLAVEQMLSKGKVSMEELRRQLGNAYAGAIQVAARAMGVVPEEFEKLLKKGLSSREFVPKLTAQFEKEFKDSLKEAVKSLDAEMTRLGNAWQLLILKFGDSGAGKQFAKVIRQITQVLSSPKLMIAIEGLGKVLGLVFDILGYLIANIKVIMYFLAPFMLGSALTRTVDLLKQIVVWIAATNTGLASTQKFLAKIFAGLILIKTAYQELKGEGIWNEITKGERKVVDPDTGEIKKVKLSKGRRFAEGVETALLGDLFIGGMFGKFMPGTKFLAKNTLGKIPFVQKMLPKNLWGNILKWAGVGTAGAVSGATNVGVKGAEKVMGGLILNQYGKPYVAPAVENIIKNSVKSQLVSKLGLLGIMAKSFGGKSLALGGKGLSFLGSGAKNLITGGFLPTFIGGSLLQQGLVTGSPLGKGTLDDLDYIAKFNPNQAKSLALQKGYLGYLNKSETLAPNITYSPSYKIDATTMTPEQIKAILDEHDRNFWQSIVTPFKNLMPNFGGNK